MLSYRWCGHMQGLDAGLGHTPSYGSYRLISIAPVLRAPWESQHPCTGGLSRLPCHAHMHMSLSAFTIPCKVGLCQSTQGPAHLAPTCEHLTTHLLSLVPGQARILGQSESRCGADDVGGGFLKIAGPSWTRPGRAFLVKM